MKNETLEKKMKKMKMTTQYSLGILFILIASFFGIASIGGPGGEEIGEYRGQYPNSVEDFHGSRGNTSCLLQDFEEEEPQVLSTTGGPSELCPAKRVVFNLGQLESPVTVEQEEKEEPIVQLPQVVKDLIRSVSDGLEMGMIPMKSTLGTSGVYFMKDTSGKIVGVFKPQDEEVYGQNNPKGYLPEDSLNGEGIKKGSMVGEGASREVMAYILDHESFARVPPTVIFKCRLSHSKELKEGSLQSYIQNDGDCEEYGSDVFPLEDIQRISVLDIRLANADRHSGNMLMTSKEDQRVLVPIDHEYSLLRSFKDCGLEWMNWRQAKMPYSEKVLSYIRKLDPQKDIELLKLHRLPLPLEASQVLTISTLILKKGAERGFTPYQIGCLISRRNDDQKSFGEVLMEKNVSLEVLSKLIDDHFCEMDLDH